MKLSLATLLLFGVNEVLGFGTGLQFSRPRVVGRSIVTPLRAGGYELDPPLETKKSKRAAAPKKEKPPPKEKKEKAPPKPKAETKSKKAPEPVVASPPRAAPAASKAGSYDLDLPVEKKKKAPPKEKKGPRKGVPPPATPKGGPKGGGISLPSLPGAPSLPSLPGLPKFGLPSASKKGVSVGRGAVDPLAKPLGIALGVAPLVGLPVIALLGVRLVAGGTLERRAEIQKSIDDGAEKRRIKKLQSNIDVKGVIKAFTFFGVALGAVATLVLDPVGMVAKKVEEAAETKAETSKQVPAKNAAKAEEKKKKADEKNALKVSQEKEKTAAAEAKKAEAEAKVAAEKAAVEKAATEKAAAEKAAADKAAAEEYASTEAAKEAAAAEAAAAAEKAAAEKAAAEKQAIEDAKTPQQRQIDKKIEQNAIAKAEFQAKVDARLKAAEAQKVDDVVKKDKAAADTAAARKKMAAIVNKPVKEGAILKGGAKKKLPDFGPMAKKAPPKKRNGLGVVSGGESGGKIQPKVTVEAETLEYIKQYNK